MSQRYGTENVESIKLILRKIKSLKIIIFPNENFNPLKEIHKKIIQTLDEKLAEPISVFYKEL